MIGQSHRPVFVHEDVDARGLEFFHDCGVAQGAVIIARNAEDARRGFKTPNQFGERRDLSGEFPLLLVAEKVAGDEKKVRFQGIDLRDQVSFPISDPALPLIALDNTAASC